MFEPPVSTPISLMMAIAASRISWYSLSVRVCAGAPVMESPVWTPIGSTFSMEQMMTTLSARSRMTSSSNSFQLAVPGEPDRGVQRRVAPEGGAERFGPFAVDDPGDELAREGFAVRALRELLVGHDRRGVRVHEDDLEPLFAERLERLGARVVELARLADDDRPRADDEDLPEIRALGHYSSTRPYTMEVSGAASSRL